MQVCEECGESFPIWRNAGKLKDDEHVKHLWCTCCKKRTAHRQEKSSKYFEIDGNSL